MPINPVNWNSNIGLSNKESENVNNGNYKEYSPTSALSNSPIFKTSNINSEKVITNEQLTKSDELLNKERKEMSERERNLIARQNTNKTNKYTNEVTPLIISKNKKSLPKHSQIDFLNTLQDMLNAATSKEKINHPGEDENSLPIHLYTNKNDEIDYVLKSPSKATEKMDFVQTPTNDDDYKNAMINKIHNLFSQYLNMEPQIDSSKYQNFQIPLPPITQEPEKRLKDQEIIKTETKSKNSKDESNSILYNNENVKNTIELSSKNIKNIQNDNKSQLEEGKIEDFYTKNCDSNSQLHFTEEKIKLPLILRQNDDGTVQLLLDKSEMCNSFNELTESNKIDEKNMCKRKTDNEDNLLKRSFNIIDQLNHDTNVPDKQIVTEEQTESDVDNDVKENFYKHLINKQLKELFHSLNVEIDHSEELHTYIDDLPVDEKDQLKQYLLSSITELYTNDLHKSMLQKEHEKYTKTLLQNNHNTHIISDKKPEEENRMYFPMQSEENNISYKNADKLIALIRAVIHSELQNSNLCPICSQRKCTCTNQNNNLLNPFSFQNEDRVIDKRQNNYNDYDSNDSGDVSPHGIVKRRYKIFNNILNWARDIIIHNNTKN